MRNSRIPQLKSHNNSTASSTSRALVFPSSISSNPDVVDEVQKYCTEGTPSWMSNSNSHSDLKVTEEVIDNEDEVDENDSNISSSNPTSSDEEDAENLLQGCIKQAWAAKNTNSGNHNKRQQFAPKKVSYEHLNAQLVFASSHMSGNQFYHLKNAFFSEHPKCDKKIILDKVFKKIIITTLKFLKER